jgi:hypothetical protein
VSDDDQQQANDGSIWGDIWEAGHELVHAAGETTEGLYHAGLAGAEAMIGAPSASDDWRQAGEHMHEAGQHMDVVETDVMDAWYKSGITHADPIE